MKVVEQAERQAVADAPRQGVADEAEGGVAALPSGACPGGAYMGAAQRDYFRRALLEWSERLGSQATTTMRHIQHETRNCPDDADRATREEEFGVELRARARERKLRRKIEWSLELLGRGEYGYCVECGEEIGLERLDARLTATLCFDCKSEAEIRERQRLD